MSVPVGQIVLPSGDDMQVRIWEVALKAPPHCHGTQWVAVTPEQENWHFNVFQLRCQIHSTGFKPVGHARIVPPKFISPLYCAKRCGIESSRCGRQNQMCNESLFQKSGLNGNNASHGLSDQGGGAIYPGRYFADQMLEAGNGRVCRNASKSWIGHKDTLGSS